MSVGLYSPADLVFYSPDLYGLVECAALPMCEQSAFLRLPLRYILGRTQTSIVCCWRLALYKYFYLKLMLG